MEKRLIDADEVYGKRFTVVDVMEGVPVHRNVVKAVDVKEAPTIDAVPVVRCKDCKYLNIINKAPLYAYCGKSNYIFHLFEEDTREHFCSWGERGEDDGV